jgi:signal transduction histidine kinase
VVSRSYRAGVDSGLSWAYAVLILGFAASWLVVAVAAGDRIGSGLWAAIAAFVVLSGIGGWRSARLRLGDRDVMAMAAVAVAMQSAWASEPAVTIASGQRCMITTAVAFGAFTFASRGPGVAAVATAVAAQFLADWTVVGLLDALDGLWPVVAAGIALWVCVPVVRDAARRADAAADEQHHASMEAAGLAAQRQANRDIQGVLHDDVVAALRAISLPEVSHAEARQAARDAVAAIERSPNAGDDDAPRDLAELIRDLAAVPGTVTTAVAGDAVVVPGDVVGAAMAAEAEVLRNVARHARATRVQIVLERYGDGFVLTTTDDGVGFRTSTATSRSHGLRHSVTRRMEDVGGRAEVTSAPGRGTTVRLAWQSASDAHRRGPTRPERIAAAIGDVRPTLASVVLPYLAMTTVFAIRSSLDGQLPGWLFVWLAGLCVITVVVLSRAHTGLSGPVAAAALAYGVVGTVASLLVLTPDALGDYSSWPFGATASLLAVMAVVRPAREAVGALLFQQGAIMAAVLAGRVGAGPWTERLATVTPAAQSTVTPVLLALVTSQAILRLGDVVTRANSDRSMRAAAESAHRARESLHRRRLADMNEKILPFLRDVADMVTAVGGDDVRETARMLEHAARDELHLPGLLDATARDLLDRARVGGCVVTFQMGAVDLASPELVRDVLVTALAAGGLPRDLVLSVQQTKLGATVGLVTVPGDQDRAAALQRRFGRALSILDCTPEATWAEVSAPRG